MQGCIQDDLSECGMGVHFRYIKNVEEVDKFATAVEFVTLYVFDENDVFVTEQTETVEYLKDSPMILPLRAGKYKLIAWGNAGDSYEIAACKPGETLLEDFVLKIKREADTVTEHPTHLFYGGVEEVDIVSGLGRKSVLIDLMKDTNSIYVKATGLPIGQSGSEEAGTAGDNPFSCTITSINGDYKFDNSITGNRLTYIPKYTVEENVLKSDFVIMRELNDGSTESRLIILHKESGKELFNKNLVNDLLLPAATKNDLDIDDEFHINIEFDQTNGSFSVSVNDFVVIEGGGSIIA
jgi:hypothetical protein